MRVQSKGPFHVRPFHVRPLLQMQVQSKGRAAEVVDLLKATAAETGSKGGGSLEGGSEDVEWISTAHLHAAEHTVVLCDALKRKGDFMLFIALVCHSGFKALPCSGRFAARRSIVGICA
uniref:Uncharacterized protein n=1 Tax=Dunaliella tertiolecta TaxID=3047 RepID=A0A7S3VQX1_DUNTE|mmetsp:Transcript_23290/g.64355  ORF Transcript_23290/g.64355 Transcript_23290/m.64355 type:complete len:119 (+) Transcript_23290:4770-5126(+)